MGDDVPVIASPPPAAGSHRRSAIIVGAAILLQTLDASLVATAIPSIAASMGQDAVALNSVITSYIVGSAVFLPISGSAADRWGARTVFLTAIGLFLLSSVACSMAQSLWQLIIARAAQGCAGAMFSPVGRLVLLRSTPKAKLVDAMAYMTVPALLGPVLGAPLAGYLLTQLSWQWIFLINVPIGLAGAIAVIAFIPNLKDRYAARFDRQGIVLSGLALAALGASIGNLTHPGASPLFVGALGLLGICFGLGYVRHSNNAPQPILDLRLFRLATFHAATIGAAFVRLPVTAAPFLLNLLFQVAFGWSALMAGGYIFIVAIGALMTKGVLGTVLRRFGVRDVLIATCILTSLSFMAFAFLDAGSAAIVIWGLLLFHGLVRSLQLTGLAALTFADVADERMGPAATLAGVCTLIAQFAGVGVAALVIPIAEQFAPFGARVDHIRIAFLVVGAACLISLLWYWRLPRRAAESLTGG